MTETAQNNSYGKCRACLTDLDGTILDERDDIKFVACQKCGSVMAHPTPTQAELDSLFADFTTDDVVEDELLLPACRKAIQHLMKQTDGKRFIDISANRGYRVQAAQDLGLEARGIDTLGFLTDWANKKFPQAKIEMMSPDILAQNGAEADIIVSIDKFCAEPDTEKLAASLSKLLASGGILYIEEPDGNHFRLPRKFANWDLVNPPFNFFYFSKEGLKTLLARHGLKVKKAHFSFSPIIRLVVTKA